MTKNLKKNALFGLSWTTLEYVVMVVIQVIQLSVLARILTPKDFGIFAIGTFFMTLGNTVFAMGMGPALIQKEGDISDYLDTAWTANLIISGIATLILLMLIPFLVPFYFKESEALYPSLVILSVVFISGLNNIGLVTYYRKIEMKRLFIYHALPKLFGAVTAIYFSILLKNFWGLVFGIVTEFLLKLILSYILLPRMPRFVIQRDKFKELYNFGGWLQLKNVFKWASNNIDLAIVGAILSTSMLGFYNRAITLARLPESQISKIINVISFPLYSAIRSDSKKLESAVNATNNLVLLILAPILLITLYGGEGLVSLILGEQWLYLTTSFQLLISAIAIQAYVISFTPLLRALGYPKYEFFYQVIRTVLLAIFIYPLTLHYGIVGAGLSILLSTLVAAPYIFIKLHKIIKLNFLKLTLSFFVSFSCFPIIYILKYYYYSSDITNLTFIVESSVSLSIFLIIIFLFSYIFKLGPFESLKKSYEILKKSNK
jgi:O-antigen/teichoic acid export membrane protein